MPLNPLIFRRLPVPTLQTWEQRPVELIPPVPRITGTVIRMGLIRMLVLLLEVCVSVNATAGKKTNVTTGVVGGVIALALIAAGMYYLKKRRGPTISPIQEYRPEKPGYLDMAGDSHSLSTLPVSSTAVGSQNMKLYK